MATFEAKTPLSQSLIWPTQKKYYQSMGIEAWAESVPFYITSNTFIAKQYAKLISSFIADYVHENPSAVDHPFPIIELGAGTGQFTCSLIKALKLQLKSKNMQHIKLNYIVTDITDTNLHFIASHHSLAETLKEEIIYFARFDVEEDSAPILLDTLENNHCSLDFKNPLITIANYLFDSLSCDVFYIENGELYESLVTLKTSSRNLTKNEPKDWSKVKLEFDNQPAKTDYYPDENMNKALHAHASEDFDKNYFIFPTGSFTALKHLKKLGKNKLLLLCSDKAFTSLCEMREQEAPTLDVHGSFSMMVNFFALSAWNAQNGGSGYIPSSRDGLTTATLITEGLDTAHYYRFNETLSDTLETFSPTDYFNLYDHATEHADSYSLPATLSLMTLSDWDPGLFELFTDRLSILLESDGTQLVDRVLEKLPQVARNYYFTPGSEDVYFSVATQYYELDHYEEALEFYELSNQYFPGEFVTRFNQGLCHYCLENYEEALFFLNQALTLEPSAKECIAQIKDIKLKLEAL